MKISVYGIGWLTKNGYGAVGSCFSHNFADGETCRTTDRGALFTRPVKNFGRLDDVSRLTLIAVSLALRDAAIAASVDNKQNIGIAGTAASGSLATDREYFTDYLANGRKLARASLFIYTLPSSPLGEAAIHFGMTGPLFYLAANGNSLVTATTMAAGLIAEGGSAMMLAGDVWDNEALYLLIGDGSGTPLFTLDEALAAIAFGDNVDQKLAQLQLIPRGSL